MKSESKFFIFIPFLKIKKLIFECVSKTDVVGGYPVSEGILCLIHDDLHTGGIDSIH